VVPVINYVMNWWKRICCFLPHSSTRPINSLPNIDLFGLMKPNCVYISGRELRLVTVTPQKLRARVGSCLFPFALGCRRGSSVVSASLWHPETALLAPALISLRTSARPEETDRCKLRQLATYSKEKTCPISSQAESARTAPEWNEATCMDPNIAKLVCSWSRI
jgi:hypothetical protein